MTIVTTNNKEDVTNVLEVLNKEDRLVIDIETKEFYTRIDSTLRNKIEIKEIRFYSPRSGKIVFIVEDNKIPQEITKLIEEKVLIAYNMNYNQLVLLSQNIELKNIESVQLMFYTLKGQMIPYKNIEKDEEKEYLQSLYEMHIKYKDKVNNDLYELILNVSKFIVRGNYFGITTDINDSTRSRLLEKINKETEQIECKYEGNLDSPKYIKEYIKENFGINTASSTRKYLRTIQKNSTDKSIIDFIDDVINRRGHMAERKVLQNTSCSIKIRCDYGLGDTSSLRNIRIPKDFVVTDPSKYYLITVDGDNMNYRYLEKDENEFIFEGNDYHSYVASKILGKDIKDVNKEERLTGKKFNFIRTRNLNGSAWNDVVIELEEELDLVLEGKVKELLSKLGTFKRRSATNMNIMILKCIDKLHRNPELSGRDITFYYHEMGSFTFKVSNKVNPYKALKIIKDSFDTREELGFYLFDKYIVTNDLSNMREQASEFIEGELVNKTQYITNDFIDFKYSTENTETKLRNIAGHVSKELISWFMGNEQE